MIAPSTYDSLGELLRDALVLHKTEVALIEANRQQESARLTYRDFRDAALRVAARLERAGIGAGDRVAILMTNQSRWLISAYAALYRGAVLVPLDYKLGPDEQQALLTHSGAVALVTEYGLFRRLTAAPPLTLVSEPPPAWVAPPGAEDWATTQEEPPEATFVPRAREDIATIVYSSGTGGTPKGCLLPHRAYLAQLDGLLRLFPMDRGDRYFSVLPTNHAIDFMVGFVGPLACGATVVHQRTLRPELLRWTMQRYGVTHMAVVPMLLTAFERAITEQIDALPAWRRAAFEGLAALNGALTERKPNHALSRRLLGPIHEAFGGRLRLMFCGGAFVERERAALFYKLGIPVVIGYGLTEACTVVTVGSAEGYRADSVGRPVPGVTIRLASPDADGVGEVQVRGDTLMRGYLDAPELTADAFDGDWLRTGDLGRVDGAGHLHLLGRSRNMVVTPGGKNIYPEDIEGAFATVPCEELAVFAADWIWPRRGLTGEQLVAVVRPGASERETLAALRERNRRLPDCKRGSGGLAGPEPFPRTASMKLKRGDLAAAVRETVDRDALRPLASVEG